ncbi:single-stranded-DNA-specific exonuclease RecJ [Parasulfuritortus cantonensis]|uniref:Single-stranded-DNA-specific exonuclease RecJ n=1 Tax=Parasulfuritortus cantonensis TaxID=2528202 RepID=A0A4R1BM72_9PROT|nr:single-stranded-DNA-specific exonuclease RecJ [Parasulfuritortus cantonensis]TCJ18571.1 single-stranded-DNA-specific exonuclease RecJ [Parasulfuritortus cantonensis]
MLNLETRPWAAADAERLRAAGFPALLARLYAARGIAERGAVKTSLAELLPYAELRNCVAAGARLADAVQGRQRLLVVADYDADGATACAVAVRGLTAMGGVVDYLVPNRFDYGYGLSPEIVRLAAERKPDLIITVDNGIAAHAGIEEARRLGIEVLVTDHHLPGDGLPEALIVNPNQPGCSFPSKSLAGVGVMFYVLIAVRAELRRRGAFGNGDGPNLAELLDLVALGTVADVVRLDANNRLLVEQGLKRMRSGRARPGIRALFQAAGRDPGRASAQDLGFVVGPRLNAAGRLADMSLGIACLLADAEAGALAGARELDRLNRERRAIEADMQEQALAHLETIAVADGYSLTLFDPAWHQGVVGLLAARLKERHHRPAVVFADGGDGLLKGSGRAIPGLHLRDALDLVDKRLPGLIVRFGGHAAAAGLTLAADRLAEFANAFEAACREMLDPAALRRVIETDGELARGEFGLDNARVLRDAVWGQGFPAPLFHGDFLVQGQRLVGDKHLKLHLRHAGFEAEAMLFNHDQPLPERIQAVYRLDVNEWNGASQPQLTVEHWQTRS